MSSLTGISKFDASVSKRKNLDNQGIWRDLRRGGA
ncbi:hypothetical protein PTE31013_00923 [Pandoraea terrigena]|uniref:Uncharacterized protein n=1 Tax=Pandoraea terrigena TaxID=2508292 RepID=A0A5E4SP23_9BURK|nr:hypothetical protein PTE31013_00923 [Pandoraea terrigena]